MEKLRSIFNFIYGYYLDYRYKVPPASALSFAYYMILSIIPICTLLAFFTPFFPLDIKTAQEILSYYLRPDVTKMVIQLIEPRSLSITTITTLIASIFVVSRGFYQLHRISKNMFPNDKEYPFFIDQGITFLKTILIFILILAVISLLIIFPFFKIIFIDQHNFITRVLFLFIIIFVILFFFLSILEDSGYMARVAFIMDKLLRKIGLSGRSIVPMLIGFGCTVPGVMASRTLSSRRDRQMTIILTPFMSCSAKLPIYAFFTSVFFPGKGALIMIFLYVFGILTGIIFALILKGSLFKGEPVPFVMELPNYRMPGAKNVCQLLWEKAKDFLQRAFTVIFVATIVIWFLQTFDLRFNIVTESKDSILAILAGYIAPIFNPLGFGDWRISTALISGFMAKESVVSTLSILYGSTQSLLMSLTTPAALSLLIFCLLYTPCIAAIAAIKRELNGKWALIVVFGQCLIAWLASFVVYHLILLVF